jgi:hypothetical protein
VLDYNQSVIVVDLTNQLIHSYLYERSKWINGTWSYFAGSWTHNF